MPYTAPPLTYNRRVEFVETHIFTRRVVEMLTEREFIELQAELVGDPEGGDLIQGTGGLRKLRWRESHRSKGKRGGVRVIYYWYSAGDLIYLLLIYSKSEQGDLSPKEKQLLHKLVAKEFK